MKTIEKAVKEYSSIIQFQEAFLKGAEFAQRWIPIEEEKIPKDGKEYITKNNNQGGVLSLISWDIIHKHYRCKSEYVFEGNAGTHWKPIELT